jgi:hypothetical protein
MVVIPAIEVALRPLLGRGIDNAPVLVQHLGLVMAMAGALAAERHGHLTTLGSTLPKVVGPVWQQRLHVYANGVSALLCGVLALASGLVSKPQIHRRLVQARVQSHGLLVSVHAGGQIAQRAQQHPQVEPHQRSLCGLTRLGQPLAVQRHRLRCLARLLQGTGFHQHLRQVQPAIGLLRSCAVRCVWF